jgi:biopolymer transport protein ExbD
MEALIGRRKRRSLEINIAPLLDMVFILLIFFVVTTSFSRQTGVDIERPQAATATRIDKENLMIAVTREGTIHIHDRQVDLPMVGTIVRKTLSGAPDTSVVLVADREARTGIAVDVIDECRLAGAKKIAIAAIKE